MKQLNYYVFIVHPLIEDNPQPLYGEVFVFLDTDNGSYSLGLEDQVRSIEDAYKVKVERLDREGLLKYDAKGNLSVDSITELQSDVELGTAYEYLSHIDVQPGHAFTYLVPYTDHPLQDQPLH